MVRRAQATGNLLLLEATGAGKKEWLIFERETELADALQRLRVPTNEEDAEKADF